MAQTPKVQIKGLIRFSYLSENGFAASRNGIECMREMLYDSDRLDRRFAMFERLALHSLRIQDDPDFAVAVLIGDSFPDKSRARLEGLIAALPQARLVSLPPMIHIQAVKQAYALLPDDPEATHIATFRLDDDDAMHRATTARIRTLGDHLLQIRDSAKPFVIAFNRGFYLNLEADDPLTEWYEETPLGVGLAMIAAKGDHATIFRRNHRQLTQYYDCFSEVEEPMYIRTVHRDNDSGASANGRQGKMGPRIIRRKLLENFGLTPDMLEGL